MFWTQHAVCWRSTRSSWGQKDGNKAPWKVEKDKEAAAMKSTVKSEIKTLADIVKSEKMSYTAKNIHWTVKSADSDDQRCKGVVFFGLQAEGQNDGCIHLLRYWWNRFYKMKCLLWKRLSPRAKRWQSQFSPMLRNCDKLYTSLYCIGWKLNREWNSNSCLLIYKALNDLAPPYISELITFNNIGSRGTSSPHVPLFMESPPGLFKLSPKSLE